MAFALRMRRPSAMPGLLRPITYRPPASPKPPVGLANNIFNAGRTLYAPRPRALPALNPVAQTQQPSQPAPPGPVDPLDAQYYSDVAQGQFRANQQIAQLNAMSQNERAALGENLRLLGEQQPVLRQNATNRANLSGLLYSGALGRQIGDLEIGYRRQESRLNDTFGQHEASRRSQLDALDRQWGSDDPNTPEDETGFGILAARIAAIERASQAAMTTPLDPGGDSLPGPTQSFTGVPSIRKTGPGRPRRPASPVAPWSPGRQGLGGRIFTAGRNQQRRR